MSGPADAGGPWRVAYWALLGLFVLTAGLNMLHVHGGFLTNHCADLVVPALLYVLTRRYPERSRAGSVLRIRRLFGRTPESAALWIFTGSAATELSQRYWPHGLFPGTFDPLDIAAYAVGVASCYLADRLALRLASSGATGVA